MQIISFMYLSPLYLWEHTKWKVCLRRGRRRNFPLPDPPPASQGEARSIPFFAPPPPKNLLTALHTMEGLRHWHYWPSHPRRRVLGHAKSICSFSSYYFQNRKRIEAFVNDNDIHRILIENTPLTSSISGSALINFSHNYIRIHDQKTINNIIFILVPLIWGHVIFNFFVKQPIS